MELSTVITVSLLWLASEKLDGPNFITDLALSPKNVVSDVKHSTSLGDLVGRSVLLNSKDRQGNSRLFYSFKKIPFAIPPVADRRWTDPEILTSKWDGVLDAREFGPTCTQMSFFNQSVVGEEDCLHLNIFTPKLPGVSTDAALLPVMFWIHGGGYQFGSGIEYLPEKLMREDIVLVTINYRLNIFGFLATGDKTLPGNYGLLDQVVALKWVSDHIQEFGGDPKLITIFGESAGAGATHLMVLSPLAKGLFQRAIIQSGNGLCDWAVSSNPQEDFEELATANGCNSNGPESAVNCLRDASPAELFNKIITSRKGKNPIVFPLFYVPVIDKETREKPYIPDIPRRLLETGQYSHVPILMGLTSNEGLVIAGLNSFVIPDKSWSKVLASEDGVFDEILLIRSMFEDVVHNRDEPTRLANKKKIRETYFSKVTPGDERQAMLAVGDLIGDRLFVSCHGPALELHRKTSTTPIYSYVFGYRNRPSFLNLIIKGMMANSIQPPPEFFTDTTHFDEVFYLFGFDGDYGDLVAIEGVSITGNSRRRDLQSQEQMSRRMTNIWAAFAKSGSLEGSVASDWVPMTEPKVNFYNLTVEKGDMMPGFRNEMTEFWESLEKGQVS